MTLADKIESARLNHGSGRECTSIFRALGSLVVQLFE